MSETRVRVQLLQVEDFKFQIDFGGEVPVLMGDEPPPLGKGSGPSPVQLLSASVGNCLSDSLLFALRKFKQSPEPLQCEVVAEVGRNAETRLRVLGIRAVLTLGVPAASLANLNRALEQFEMFCTVTQSVSLAIPVKVEIFDALGMRLK
jgi:uncharacterized OsmC-like protein